MKLRLPIYVEGATQPPRYTARPLFWPDLWRVQSPLLQKVLQLAVQSTHQAVEERRREPRLTELAALTFCPELREHLLNLRFEFDKRTAQCRLLLVTFEAFSGKVGFSPTVPDLWFPLTAHEPLEAQAAEAWRRLLRQQKKQGMEPEPELFSVTGRAWIHYCELEVSAPGTSEPPAKKSLLALLGAPESLSGGEDLARVGRSLDRRVAENPEVFLGRQRELEELASWHGREARGGLLIVGPRLVGKSALIRAHVARLLEQRADPAKPKKTRRPKKRRGTWLLSPGRLISGMSYLGQWENRLLNILRHCRRQDHVVVFDDMLGLLSAGISRDSSLNVAQLLKSFLDRGDLRVLGEITPEAYQVLRERDRALADHFQVLFLDPPEPAETRSIALAAARAAESSQACTFSLEAIHQALLVGDRYLTDCSHPGKVARLLHQVAAHHRHQAVGAAEILQWFSHNSGLSLQLLDPRATLESSQVEGSLREQMVGQNEAVTACLEVVHLTKARVGPPSRPVASLLFIGPTGVGKTECAKALARTLFGSQDRLIRLDMNEYLGSDSMARLIGTFHRPEGLLTEAVRSQPFSVLLLDEIEKADPQVLLLLLQMLGDGRLSDARGRTVDFTQTIVVMTSNLGADQTQKSLGLRSRRQQEELVYRRAAEEFFPPELFNRIDRIVPFHRLDRVSVGQIAERLWHRLLLREGLRRRQCLLEVAEEAREQVIDAGFHPKLGARALKRTVEEKVVGPVARHLAGLPPRGLTLIRVAPDLTIEVQRLAQPQATRRLWGELDEKLLRTELDQAEGEIEAILRPIEQELYNREDMQEMHMLCFELKEEVRRLRGALWPHTYKGKPRKGSPLPLRRISAEQTETLLGTDELQLELEALGQDLSSLPHIDVEIRLDWLKKRLAAGGDEEFSLRLKGQAAAVKALQKAYLEAFPACDIDCSPRLELVGRLARQCGRAECGLHLMVERHSLHCVWVSEGDAAAPLRLVRIYAGLRACLDLPTGLYCRSGWPLAAFLRTR